MWITLRAENPLINKLSTDCPQVIVDFLKASSRILFEMMPLSELVLLNTFLI